MRKEASAAPRGARTLVRTLVIDIGGSGIKAETLDANGKPITQRSRIPTPKKATPKQVIAIIRKLAKEQGGIDRISVGFPGVIKDGVVYTAANLGKGWKGFPLEGAVRKKLGHPVRLANDADVQGLGAARGHGLELVVTLGTGFGSVVFVSGARLHLELGHHPFRKGRTYEDELGHRALIKKGKKRWNRHLREAIKDLKQTFNYDRLYIGGGNASKIIGKLDPDVKIISNDDGLLGGIKLWRDAEADTIARRGGAKAEEPEPSSSRSSPTDGTGRAMRTNSRVRT